MSTIPELTQHQRDLMHMGLCPFCERSIQGYKPPVGWFAPEAYATLRERGIDPSNGHKQTCQYKSIKIKR